MAPPIRITIVEDQAGLALTFQQIVNLDPELECTAVYGDVETAAREIPRLKSAIATIDLCLGRPGDGIGLIRHLKGLLPELSILVLTVSEDAKTVVEAIEAGANGYLVKRRSAAKLAEAIKELRDGGSPLTPSVASHVLRKFHERGEARAGLERLSPQEANVLGLIAQGRLYKEIASELNIAIVTVKEYVERIIKKLQVNSRAEAVAKYLGHAVPSKTPRRPGNAG